MILEPKKIKYVTASTFFPFYLPWNMGPNTMMLVFFNVEFEASFFFFCSGLCHTLKWISHGFTCVPHPDPPSHLPLKLAFSLSSFTFIKRLFSSFSLSAIRVVSSAHLVLLISDIQSANIFSHSLGSILTMASLDAQKFLILMKSNLFFFSFSFWAF